LANADAPKIRRALKLDHSGRARLDYKRLDLPEDPPRYVRIKVL
jgi:hypothetical protein